MSGIKMSDLINLDEEKNASKDTLLKMFKAVLSMVAEVVRKNSDSYEERRRNYMASSLKVEASLAEITDALDEVVKEMGE